jgi:hypothetical protein
LAWADKGYERQSEMIEPSVAGVLRSQYTIRRFYALCIVALILLLAILISLAEVFGLDWVREAAISILAHLAAAVLVLMLIYWVWIWVTPPELRSARVMPPGRRDPRGDENSGDWGHGLLVYGAGR